MLLVVTRTGAEPTFGGGGELARDIDADVIEALSEMISLVGVPGRSSLELDAMLAWREDTMVCGNIEVVEDGVALLAGGNSDFGVGTSLNVFGAFLARGD
jgi:hypothetical protein